MHCSAGEQADGRDGGGRGKTQNEKSRSWPAAGLGRRHCPAAEFVVAVNGRIGGIRGKGRAGGEDGGGCGDVKKVGIIEIL